MNEKIEILISVYNGEKYLKDQIQSILQQDYNNWEVLIRDDGSNDKSLTIINNFLKEYPNKFKLLKNSGINLGPKQSYNNLLQEAKAEYIALCDQDDLWECNKLSFLLKIIKIEEQKLGKAFPILIHSDLKIINEESSVISNSFYKYSGLNPLLTKGNSILFKNVVPGCAMLFNKALLSKVTFIPQNAIMHDYWLLLHAKFLGKIVYVRSSLIRYRLHAENTLGINKKHEEAFFSKLKKIYYTLLYGKRIEHLNLLPYQLQLAELVNSQAELKSNKSIVTFLNVNSNISKWKRRLSLLKLKISKESIIDTLVFYIEI